MGMAFGIFNRRDVRDTALIAGTPKIGDFTSAQHNHSATASGGTVDHANITTIGTNSHAQVDTHIANTANPHTVVLTDVAAPGEGIDFSGSSILGEDATTTNKGICSFNSTDFDVAGGAVTIDDSNTVRTCVAGAGIDVSSASGNVTITGEESTAGNLGIVIVSPGEGIDVNYASGTATVSGEDATTANKGIASFNTNHFTVSTGAVSLKNTSKEFFVLPLPTILGSGFDAVGGFGATAISQSREVYFNFIVPNDFSSLTGAKVVIIPDTTETIQWDITVDVAAVGENYNIDTRTGTNESLAVTVDDMTEIDISSHLTGLTAGDYVGVNFQSDTDFIKTIGARITYTI